MLSVLDRHIRTWHFLVANGVAIAWFIGMSLATQSALPSMKLFRCPIGLCPGYYSPIELQTTLTKIGRNGREFLSETLLPLDMVLPALLLVALTITYVWFSRPGGTFAVPLSSGRPLRAFVRAPAVLPGGLRRELEPRRGPAGLSQYSLPHGAKRELSHGREIAAHCRLARNRRRPRDRCGTGTALERVSRRRAGIAAPRETVDWVLAIKRFLLLDLGEYLARGTEAFDAERHTGIHRDLVEDCLDLVLGDAVVERALEVQLPFRACGRGRPA